MLSDEEIDVAHVKFAWVNLNCTEHRDAFARAIESAATAPLLARIAELVNTIEKGKDLMGGMALKVAELEQQLAEARKQMEAQKDEWLSWEAKRRDLEKDAELGRTAMRFVDRAGDPHPSIDDADKICAEFYAAMCAVVEEQT